jgi:hypothetical protein
MIEQRAMDYFQSRTRPPGRPVWGCGSRPYQGRTPAACTPDRVFLSNEIDANPHDPLSNFVFAMSIFRRCPQRRYARLYRDEDARAYARCIDP